ncbi:nucleotide-diphospho-sugar transferase [Hymenobacter sp. BT730]|uniref:nucleotide-diphospho-sugar transferase n=1 Tax=Hymenobacter sp. BT730 TaxID=3063332 RepID=UPI0026DED06E|nr:nucleotide-diphospho-sugar transferase [Hymenobacter sp. BT730]
MPPSPVSCSTADRETAVLFVIFNRPELTRQSFEAIRAARPARLYVAADGPRASRPHEAGLCAQTRAVVTDGIDWPCQLQTLFQPTNLGCSRGVSTGINWFFEQEPEGIILEDDCVAGPDFFPFCQELLSRYRHDTRVMHIGGNNLFQEAHRHSASSDSYYFSSQVHSWGWATWRRAWQLYDFEYALLPELRRRGLFRTMYPSVLQRYYWLQKFEGMRREAYPPHTWDYQWHFTVAANSGLAIIPAVNLVQNIGLGPDATHTVSGSHHLAGHTRYRLSFPLQHPTPVLGDYARDQRQFRRFLAGRFLARLKRLLMVPEKWRPRQLSPSETAPASGYSVPAT